MMLKLLRGLSKKELVLALVCLILIVGQVWLDLKLPEYLAEITRLVQTDGSEMSDVLMQGGFMLLCALGSLILSIIVGYLASLIAAVFTKVTQLKVFQKVSSFSMGEIKKFSVGSLITRTTNDVTQVRGFISIALHLLIKSPILAVWAIIKIWQKNFGMTLLTAGFISFMLLAAIILIIIVLPKFKIIQELTDSLNRVTREGLVGIRVVRAFNADKYQEDRFGEANTNLKKTQMFTQRSMAIMWPVVSIVMNGLTLGIYFIGAYQIDAAAHPERLEIFTSMIVFMSYAMQVVMSFIMLMFVFIVYPQASVSAKRIQELLKTDAEIKEGDLDSGSEVGTVEFKNVSFKYPDSTKAEGYMLRDISFKANKGETVAIIGSTGCGKSSLINLIPRFYDASEGEVLVNGLNVKEYKSESLNNVIGYIPQKAVIFNRNIKDNIAYGKVNDKKVKLKDVEYAIDIAQATEIIEKMPKKLKTNIAQGGINISGGQKQRIAIARAIAKKPQIYIFDDSFSALDYKTDYLLRKELNDKEREATKIIVAQRIGTIKEADQIIVLDEGKIVGHGKHEELLKNCEVYKEIAYSQLTKEELANGN